MSFSINLDVDEHGTVTITSCTTGTCAPPPGSYAIHGHVPSWSTSPVQTVGVTTPIGAANAYLTPIVEFVDA